MTRLNKMCNIEDWESPRFQETVRRILPYFLEQSQAFPSSMEHRKHWEFFQLLNGFRELGILRSDAWILAVAAGQEEVAFDLTNDVRWVFCTDIYGSGSFSGLEAAPEILINPDAVARCPYNRRRLVVQYMDALDLRYEDATFDATYSLSSIEHFGGIAGAVAALAEQRRVVKRGGIVAFTTEVIINGAEPLAEGNLALFTPKQISDLCHKAPGLELVEPIDFTVSQRTRQAVISLAKADEDAKLRNYTHFPQMVLEHEGRNYTSISLFLRATSFNRRVVMIEGAKRRAKRTPIYPLYRSLRQRQRLW